MKKLFFALAITLLFSACGSIKISENLSPAELIQRAHEAMDRNNYNTATKYYQALYDRNQSNTDLIITAEYHIAFIHYKQRKFEKAKEELNGVLMYYNTPDQELLPQHFKRLSQIVLESIDKKENRNKKEDKKSKE